MSSALFLRTPVDPRAPDTPPRPGARKVPERQYHRGAGHEDMLWQSIYRDVGPAVAAFIAATETEEDAQLIWSS